MSSTTENSTDKKVAKIPMARRLTTVRERSEAYASHWTGKDTTAVAQIIFDWCNDGVNSNAATIKVRAYSEDTNTLYDMTLLEMLNGIDASLPDIQPNTAGQVRIKPGMCVSAGIYNFTRALMFVSSCSSSSGT
jgi:hypothetical protein